MIKVEWFYWVCAALFLAIALVRLRDRRDPKHLGSALFWALVAFSFVYGTFVVNKAAPAWIEGAVVLTLAILAGLKLPGHGSPEATTETEREVSAQRHGNWLFVPALVIPLVAAVCAVMGMKNVRIGGQLVFQQSMATIIGLGIAAVVALVVAMVRFRVSSPVVPVEEADRLLGHIGWAAILPQYLATLGVLFTNAGIGKAVGRITGSILPHGSLLAAVAVYCAGMALFTVIMGNAFAAFPVMTAAVGWPVLIGTFHGNAPAVFAMGMLAGFCGTLVTPMAANFNLVPAALLELKDPHGPIKAQLPTAVVLFVCNTALMYLFCFHH